MGHCLASGGLHHGFKELLPHFIFYKGGIKWRHIHFDVTDLSFGFLAWEKRRRESQQLKIGQNRLQMQEYRHKKIRKDLLAGNDWG